MDDEVEVVDAELVDDDHLPAVVQPVVQPVVPARPVVDRHTILYPGQDLPIEADTPTYCATSHEFP
ncbi:hypothetical protein ABT124_40100 [Streptomyces sp. NPDC001982]|uniref:hypothetical protein n=1 Tax=Streptomyces sp. NPDC001982 TaxID=3154405 RepID=UPI00332BB031